MDFKLFKKPLRQTSLIGFILFIIAAIVGIVIEAMDLSNALATKIDDGAVARLVLTIVDALVLSLFLWLMHLVPSLVSLNYIIVKKKFITKDEVVIKKQIQNPWWLHLVTVLVMLAIFFLSVTSMMEPFDNNWIETIKYPANWILCLVAFFVNLGVFEFAYNYNVFKLNRDPDIKKAL